MEQFKVFSMLADTVVFSGTKEQCDDYVTSHSNSDDSLYTIKA